MKQSTTVDNLKTQTSYLPSQTLHGATLLMVTFRSLRLAMCPTVVSTVGGSLPCALLWYVLWVGACHVPYCGKYCGACHVPYCGKYYGALHMPYCGKYCGGLPCALLW